MQHPTDRQKYLHLLDQVAWIRGRYDAINRREPNQRVGEILDLLDRAVHGEDIREIPGDPR